MSDVLTAEQIAEIYTLAKVNKGSGDLQEWVRFAIAAANAIIPTLDQNAALTAALVRCVEALEHIKNNEGKVCENFEICEHVACQSSYAAWACADKALASPEVVALAAKGGTP